MADENPTQTPPAPPATAPVPAPNPAPAPPPAAVVVKTGVETEESNRLRAELDEERGKRKKAETDAAYAQDEARRLKETQTTRSPRKTAKASSWTFFDEATD